MKASLRWIKEFVDLPTTDAAVVAAALDGLGLEVEAITEVGTDFRGVIVARVTGIRPHPAADRVRLVTIDTGGESLEVVCGAWNFETGATVAYATVGSRLAGGLDVGERDIRGVMSPGMICSERELGIGDEGGGILVLEDSAKPGTDLAELLDLPDVVFDVAITPNRPDAMSIYGLARELAAHFGAELRPLEGGTVPRTGTTAAKVDIQDPEGCPRFTAQEISGVTVRPSPLWMRLRLRNAGVRPISNVVDVTNYVMLETGQPLHAFDLDRIPDQTIVVRRARVGEQLTTLDGVVRALDPADLVIASPRDAVGLAGIMGGGDSEVSDATTRVLLEVAHFDPATVLLTGKRHALRTEAVARFERGVDPELPPVASARATALITRIAGGAAVGDLVDAHPRPRTPVVVDLKVGEVERLLGVRLFAVEIGALLRRLGFTVKGEGPLRVTVPSWRPDVTRPADLVEEVARLHGLDNIPATVPHGPGAGLPAWERRRRVVRNTLIGAGYSEIYSFDFLGTDHLARLGVPETDRRRVPVRVRNPLNDEQAVLRTTLLPGLLDGLRINAARNQGDAALFEIGSVFFPNPGAPLPDQPLHLGFAAMGSPPGAPWQPRPGRDAFDAIGLVEALATATGVALRVEQEAAPELHPGRGGKVLAGEVVLGVVGELRPDVAAAWDLTGRVIVGELSLAAWPDAVSSPFVVPSVFPPVVFDLAFDLAERTPASKVLGAIASAGWPYLEQQVVFDVFTGPPLQPGRMSLAVRLTFRHPDRTMVDQEMVPIRAAIVAAVADATGGILRGG